MAEIVDVLESAPLMKKNKRAKKESSGSGAVSDPVAVRLWRNFSFMSFAFGTVRLRTTLHQTFYNLATLLSRYWP